MAKFTICEEKIVESKVSVHVPMDGNCHQVQEFNAKLKILSDEETKKMQEEGIDEEMLSKILVDFSGVEDENGNDVECTPETKKALTKYGYVKLAILQAYTKACFKAQRKN